MCFVTYVPNYEGWVISSNRDEAPARAATELGREVIRQRKVYYPKDIAGGSWIAVSENGESRIILNGAFHKHQGGGNYKMSRGVMLRQSFVYEDIISFIAQYDFWGIEPFTMICQERNILIEFRWDGSVKHVEDLNMNESYAWSSCTLYDEEWQSERERYWRQILDATPREDREAVNLAKIQLSEGPNYPKESLKMDRNGIVCTISISQVIRNESISLWHKDLASQKVLKINNILN